MAATTPVYLVVGQDVEQDSAVPWGRLAGSCSWWFGGLAALLAGWRWPGVGVGLVTVGGHRGGPASLSVAEAIIGDAGGAAATYELDTPCGATGLPAALAARTDTGGITQVSASNVVELRTGRYNMTAALADDPSKADVPTG
ncbi:MAG: hypothetical protein OXH20_11935 [bacterium]|nr:hypothetical protein [bacterium]MXZ30112.1 hypothetical protein [Acidimicrobiia bacterium]